MYSHSQMLFYSWVGLSVYLARLNGFECDCIQDEWIISKPE